MVIPLNVAITIFPAMRVSVDGKPHKKMRVRHSNIVPSFATVKGFARSKNGVKRGDTNTCAQAPVTRTVATSASPFGRVAKLSEIAIEVIAPHRDIKK